MLTEFDFLLDILSVVIEPAFVPFEYGQRSEESQDRYIAAEVKRAVRVTVHDSHAASGG